MKLYLKIKIEGGKILKETNPLTTDLTGYEVRLYNEEATEVPDEKAKRLLEQDPHLVSKKSYDEKEDANVIGLKEFAKKEEAKTAIGRKETPEEKKSRLRFEKHFDKSSNQINNPVQMAIEENLEKEVSSEENGTDWVETYAAPMHELAKIDDLVPVANKDLIDWVKKLGGKFDKKANKKALITEINERAELITVEMEKQLASAPE